MPSRARDAKTGDARSKKDKSKKIKVTASKRQRSDSAGSSSRAKLAKATSSKRYGSESKLESNVLMGMGTMFQSCAPNYDAEDAFLAKYSLDDMRRLARKLMVLGVVDESQVDNYVKDDSGNQKSERVLCTYERNVKWSTYKIKSQKFMFPHFMTNPVYLARGGFGTVVKCFRYGEPVAVKKVAVPEEEDWEMTLRLLRELVIMKQAKKLNQRHICKIIDIFGDPAVKKPRKLTHLYIVMPLYKPGALDTIEVTDAGMFKTIAGHSLSALHFLHRHKIMHRDIKKDNIFFDRKKNRAYLADLGQARTWNARDMSGNGEVGTRCYISPEILQGHHYDYRSDVYSLGQTWYECLCEPITDSLFPYGKSGGAEQISMQKALDPIRSRMRRPGSDEPHGLWATEKWNALQQKKKKWKEESLVNVIEHTLMFDPENRADTHKLFQLPYFFPFITDERTMDLNEVDTNDYDEIMKRLFDLQHGSCQNQPGSKGNLEKMCSMAVQYFADANDDDDDDDS